MTPLAELERMSHKQRHQALLGIFRDLANEVVELDHFEMHGNSFDGIVSINLLIDMNNQPTRN